MELQKQLERIEQIKSDRNIQMILAGTKTINSIMNVGEELIGKHLSKKNTTINQKLYEFSHDVTDTMDPFADKYFQDAEKAIRAFCGFDENYVDGISIYAYIFEEVDMDEFVESLKNIAVSINDYKIDVRKGLTPSLDERITAIEQLKTNKEVLNLFDQINTEYDYSTMDKLSNLIAEKIWLPNFEVFELVQFVPAENSIDKLLSDLIHQSKCYVNGGYFREEDE